MKHFGLVGFDLKHSFSVSFFEDKFKRDGILNTSYKNFELSEISDFSDLLQNNSFSGLNVTIPYKESIIPFLDSLSSEAKSIGAVNTIEFKEGKLIGHNTDHIGFHNSIKPFLENTMERALILGTGGASKAVIYALTKIGIDCLSVSRKPKENQLSYEDLNEYVFKHHLLVVNTTPLGTSPNINECPEIPYKYLTEKHLLVDLVYNPSETLFLKKGKKQNATILNGNAMLIHQAEAAWAIWNS
ncbi:MAG: shikimate dehydrogenase [Flavobacteriales bacterium]|jgi:shikimate dehydrogenase|tara:strand:+ start:1377 stop:2105 length:729 start_codon:yes stop_codon:yes gene_type:complete